MGFKIAFMSFVIMAITIIFLTLFYKVFRKSLLVCLTIAIPVFLILFKINPGINLKFNDLKSKSQILFERSIKLLNEKENEKIELSNHGKIYLSSIRSFNENKILGGGLKSYKYQCFKYVAEDNTLCSTHPHNYHLEILHDSGFVGFAFLLFAFFYVMRGIFKSKKKINFNNNFNKDEVSKIILLVGIFINLWPLIPSGNFFNNWLSMLYFYPIGFYLYFRFKNEK